MTEATDSLEVARLLHNAYRCFRSNGRLELAAKLNNPVAQLTQAYVQRKTPRHVNVPVHILGFYKESGQFDAGIEFWNWLLREGRDEDLDLRTFGAAIEMLTLYGASPEHCEELYKHALQRSGQGFASYHLSHHATLPNLSARFLDHRETSMGLLQGILTARILHDRWREAYLALDTAFRIRPTQIPTRFLELFLYHRPVEEAFQVFYRFLKESLRSRLNLVEAMMTALEAYVGSAGNLDVRHLNKIIANLEMLHIGNVNPRRYVQDGSESFSDPYLPLSAAMIGAFAARDIVPNIVTFNEIIMSAGRRKNDKILQAALQDLKTLGLTPTASTGRSLIYALRNPIVVQNGWNVLFTSLSASGEPVQDSDWIRFARSSTSPHYSKAIEVGFDLAEKHDLKQQGEEEEYFYDKDDEKAAKELYADITGRLANLSQGRYRNFKQNPLESMFIWEWPSGAAVDWERRLYNELTNGTIPSTFGELTENSRATSEHFTKASSATGVPYDELRFLNWQSINRLLVQAEAFDHRMKLGIDQAIREGRPATQVDGSSKKRSYLKKSFRYPAGENSLELYQQDLKKEESKQMTEEEWRERIILLRQLDQAQLQSLNDMT
ncbi:MAG: hypothetical protein Q9190_004813 [Brigantiaea leucoxantha]